MDKNTIIGFILIACTLIGFSYYTNLQNSKMNDESVATVTNDSTAPNNSKVVSQEVVNNKVEVSKIDSSALFFEAMKGENKEVVLQNNKLAIKLSTKGGYISEAIIKEYLNQEKEPVVLFDKNNQAISFTFAGKNENINTQDYYFTPINQTDSTVTMQLKASNGGFINLDYKLLKNNYMVNLTISSKGLKDAFALNSNKILINWNDRAKQQEKGFNFESQYSSLTYKEYNGSTSHLDTNKDDNEDVQESLDWIAYKNQFFSAALIAYPSFTNASLSSEIETEESGFLKNYHAQVQTKFDPSGLEPTNLQYYIGPNKFRLLQQMNDYSLSHKDLDLEQLVYLGWPFFRWINRFFTIYVFDWLTDLGLPMGVVLLLITLLLRAIVYPTTRKSYLSSAKMRLLKPKMDDINKKYPNKEDAMKKQQEIMGMYSKYGVSPMGGCLPMLLQMPIWIAMFNFVPNAIELRQQSFLWADDLSTYDEFISFDHSIWLIGDHISLFCVLFCITNLVYSYMNIRMQKDSMAGQQAEQMKMMQWMTYAMPVFFFFMFNNYSSGLNYYYFISLLTGALSMWYLRKTTDEAKLLAKLEANYKENASNPKKVSGLAARLEALQQQQQQMSKKQKNK